MRSSNPGQLTSSEELKNVFNETFPEQDDIVLSFGYGSGVFVQQHPSQVEEAKIRSENEKSLQHGNKSNTNLDEKMLDMIIVVRDALRFHTTNMHINPHHYSRLFKNNPVRATWWQRHSLPYNRWFKNPKLFFNFVDTPRQIKYGIMQESDLSLDLTQWESLYVGGRMHKPTATILHNSQQDVNILELQENYNLPAAVSTALLLSVDSNYQRNSGSESRLSFADLFSHISALSYTGDFRMQVGAEDPSKISKLVHSPGQLERFHRLYHGPSLLPLQQLGVLTLNDADIQWNPHDVAAIHHLWHQLPHRFQKKISVTRDQHPPLTILQQTVRSELLAIVGPAARYQSFKGLFTAGFSKSARYAWAKLSKGILRR